ncbi:flagellin N-terminal helical domain-containing protein [Roseiarcus sp.]|uniref:flagellin n=1 Tax=Roseiarcus sp. TaxID=1969460 RepID=UPI003F9A5E0A
MSSILHNAAALSALQALNMTQQSLATVQSQVSTGLAVANASDNSSYWSIAQQLSSDSGVVTASNTALSEGQSVLGTATSAINSVITTLNSMATQLTQAQNPGASLTNINTSLASLGQQLTDAVNGASFNGLNVLNGSQTTMNFVSGFNANATGGSVNTINFTAQALTGGAQQTASTTTQTISVAAQITNLKNIQGGYAAATVGSNQLYEGTTATGGNDTMTVVSVDKFGNTTTSLYTATGAGQTGNLQADAATGGIITSVNVQTTYTPAALANTTTSTVANATAVANLLALTANPNAPTVSSPQILFSTGQGNVARAIVNSVDANGNLTTKTYTALDANGNAIAYTASGAAGSTFNGAKGITGVASFAVSTSVTPAASSASSTVSTTSTVTDATTLANLKGLAVNTTNTTLPTTFKATYGNNYDICSGDRHDRRGVAGSIGRRQRKPDDRDLYGARREWKPTDWRSQLRQRQRVGRFHDDHLCHVGSLDAEWN